MAGSDFHFCEFRFFPRRSLWSGKGWGAPLPPLVFHYSKDALCQGPGPLLPSLSCPTTPTGRSCQRQMHRNSRWYREPSHKSRPLPPQTHLEPPPPPRLRGEGQQLGLSLRPPANTACKLFKNKPAPSLPPAVCPTASVRTLFGGGQGRIGAEERGGGLTLLLDNCSLKGFGTGKSFWPILLLGCGWLLLIPGALWVVAIIHPQVAPEKST